MAPIFSFAWLRPRQHLNNLILAIEGASGTAAGDSESFRNGPEKESEENGGRPVEKQTE